jgi:hypothetical protein
LNHDCVAIAKAAIKMAISSRTSEEKLIPAYKEIGILVAAVYVGGDFSQSTSKIIERALVASKRGGLIKESYVNEGAVAGAAKDALMQITPKANGLNVGGKIGIARSGQNVCVCIFMSIGVVHMNEAVIGLGHRSLPDAD